MNKFSITITTADGKRIAYTAIGDRSKIIDGIYDERGVCGITVRPA